MKDSEFSDYIEYDDHEKTGGWAQTDCSVRDIMIGFLIIALLYYIFVYKPKEGMWSPVKEGMWIPKEGMWIPKEGMWSPVKEGMYDESYHMAPADQYTSPYAGSSGYGQNFGPPSV